MRSAQITEAGWRAASKCKQAKPAKARNWNGRAQSDIGKIAGVAIVLATGRSFHFTRHVTEALALPLTLIVNNGAVVKHADGTTVMRHVLPRAAASGYYGDLTRTVVRGRASGEQRRLWETVNQGQALALKKMKPGVNGLKVPRK
jgi:methionine aminopeptidase